MFKKLLSVLLMAILVTMTWMASAQNHTVKGVVNDNIGPVVGAGVVVQGTTNGVITDFDGSFTLNNVPTVKIANSFHDLTQLAIHPLVGLTAAHLALLAGATAASRTGSSNSMNS